MSYRLAIFDVSTGSTETVLETDRLIEAPNWTPDNEALIVNSRGLLFRVGLNAPSMEKIDTARLCTLNNDHGISPDGRTLVISDSTKTDESCIYTLPVLGGAPKRVTDKVPSWWHGWSPDGELLAFTARRGGRFDIYTIGVEGGLETRLTSGFEHADGPDFSPCGSWIWFNGQRAGQMDLWRMRTDGSDLEQMTSDDAVNWFPHPSPNGRDLLYIAYNNGVQGHPRDHRVELRLMPLEGGESHCLYKMTGGQGSINVPCWNPSGDRFAFVETREGDPKRG